MARHFVQGAAVSLLALAVAMPAAAQDRGISYTLYGTPGLLEMPSALSARDGQIAATLSYGGGQVRNTFTFQVTPRLSGSFRYTAVDDLQPFGDTSLDGYYFDRSFDLRYRLMAEEGWRPEVAVGFQDFLGTGYYSGEYLVATRRVTDSWRVTAGLGWGRFGSAGGIDNPFGLDDRPTYRPGETGGTVLTDQIFRGDMGVFGGVEYAASDRLTFKAEYSSDAYVDEGAQGLIEVDSPINVGMVWRPRDGVQLGAAWMYGNEIGLWGTFILNPNDRPTESGFDAPPYPVAVRSGDARAAQTWDRAALPEATLRETLRTALADEGITLDAVEIGDHSARVRYTNTRYRTEAQAMGRVARVLTTILPPSVESITLEPQSRGIPMTAATFLRSDLERFENRVGGTDAIRAAGDFSDAGPTAGLTPVANPSNPFTWGLAPYLELIVFDGQNPLGVDLGVEATASYRFAPNLILSGAIRKSLTPTDEIGSIADSSLPPVRRNAPFYTRDGDPGLQSLTLAWYGRPGTDLYSRVSVGYLERMFGGVSGELLWAPVDSRLALGAEVNYAVQRDFDLGFGFQDYDVVTGHVSAYYDIGNGFHAQVDAGRYLAGDWGATFTLDREFENGWRIGGYFTLTDVPFEDFGEGSFDKGIRITIPTDFFLGQPTRREISNTLQSLTRDGGARLNVDGRLYETVRGGHMSDLDDSWGRFWR